MTTAPPATAALELSDLEVAYRVRGQWRRVLRGVSLQIAEGESYGLVGESGCGKSTAAFAALRYLPRNGRVSSGSISVAGEDLLAMSDADVRRLRASKVSMVYQNPTGALNPSLRIGDQVAEAFTLQGVAEREAADRAREMLVKVQISDPDGVMRRYPHQLSGGMNQRVIIAMALAKDPALLILDEPTTGLDATVEAEVLDLVAALREEFRSSVLFISHSLDVIARMCDRVGVLYAGRVVEQGTVDDVFNHPRHPYTVGLLRCIPRGGATKAKGKLDTIPGFLPGLGATLPGCVFADRCALKQDVCVEKEPELIDLGGDHSSRCHFHEKAPELPRAESATPVKVERADGERHADPAHGERAQDVPPGRPRRARGRGPHLRARGGRDARSRRRVRQREDDPRPAAPRAHRAGRGLDRRAGRHAARGQHPQARPRAGQGRPDRLPEPGLGAEPAVLDPAHHRPRRDDADGREGREDGVAPAATSPTRCASTCA